MFWLAEETAPNSSNLIEAPEQPIVGYCNKISGVDADWRVPAA